MNKNKIRISVICAVYNSHQVFSDQILYLSNELTDFDDIIEVILVDDGSDPSLDEIFRYYRNFYFTENTDKFTNFVYCNTYSKINWNQPAARNLGAKIAQGDYFLFFDIDHIITKSMVVELMAYAPGSMMRWRRKNAVLEHGKLIEDEEVLTKNYGAKIENIRGLNGEGFNIFGLRRDVFEKVGGYDESFCGKYGGEDTDIMRKIREEIRGYTVGKSLLYHYPSPRKHPEIFHDLHSGGSKDVR